MLAAPFGEQQHPQSNFNTEYSSITDNSQHFSRHVHEVETRLAAQEPEQARALSLPTIKLNPCATSFHASNQSPLPLAQTSSFFPSSSRDPPPVHGASSTPSLSPDWPSSSARLSSPAPSSISVDSYEKCLHEGAIIRNDFSLPTLLKPDLLSLPTPPRPDSEHASMHWSFCYDDNCLAHYEAKIGQGWFPQKSKNKPRKTTRRPLSYAERQAEEAARRLDGETFEEWNVRNGRGPDGWPIEISLSTQPAQEPIQSSDDWCVVNHGKKRKSKQQNRIDRWGEKKKKAKQVPVDERSDV